MTNNNNSFFDAFKAFGNNEQFSKMFSQMPNMETFNSELKKNSNAMQAAYQVATHNTQEFTRHSNQRVQSFVNEFSRFAKDMTGVQSAEQASRKQQEYMRHVSNEALNTMKDFIDMSIKSVNDLYDAYNPKCATATCHGTPHHSNDAPDKKNK